MEVKTKLQKRCSVELYIYNDNNTKDFSFEFPTVQSANSFINSVMESFFISSPTDYQIIFTFLKD